MLRQVAPFCVLLLAVSPAQAITLGDSFIQNQVLINSTGVVEEGTTSVTSSLTLGANSGTVTADVQPSPNIRASATAAPGGTQTLVFSFLQYYFGLSGPEGVEVPIIITASGAVSTPGASVNQAILSLTTPFSGEDIAYACASIEPVNCADSDGPSFAIAMPLTVLSERAYILGMTLHVVANTFHAPGSSDSSWGWIDPIISIDPLFADADLFELTFSAGVGNTPLAAVPLPFGPVLLSSVLVSFASLVGGASAPSPQRPDPLLAERIYAGTFPWRVS